MKWQKIAPLQFQGKIYILSDSFSDFIYEWQITSQIPFKLIIIIQLFVQSVSFKLRYIFPQNIGWEKIDLNLEIKKKKKRILNLSCILLITAFNLMKEESFYKVAKCSSLDVWKKMEFPFTVVICLVLDQSNFTEIFLEEDYCFIFLNQNIEWLTVGIQARRAQL